jgi:hypothetical protein
MNSNREVLYEIVKKYFAFSKEGFEKFEYYLKNPYDKMDGLYKSIIKDEENLKTRFELPLCYYERFDEGWRIFRAKFPYIVNKFNINYSNFRDNKIIIDKNERKLVKYLEKFIFEDCSLEQRKELFPYDYLNVEKLRNFFATTINDIGAKKISKGKMELVFTMDIADWFLCSTAEKWSSCINLESQYEGNYWSGLPGLIGDKNRAMIYITDGFKKTYLGITTDRYLSRSWVLLGKDNILQIVKFYPSSMIEDRKIKDFTNINFRAEINQSFESKYPIDPIYFANEKTAGVFQDGYGLCQDLYLRYGHHGYNYIYKGRIYSEPIFDGRKGLSSIIDEKKTLNNYMIKEHRCHSCDARINYGNIFQDNENNEYCTYCFNKKFFSCQSCGHVELIENMKKNSVGYKYCKRCYDERYIACANCKKEMTKPLKKTYKNDKEEEVCENCFYAKYAVCCSCKNHISNKENKIKTKSGKLFCSICAEQKHVKRSPKKLAKIEKRKKLEEKRLEAERNGH